MQSYVCPVSRLTILFVEFRASEVKHAISRLHSYMPRLSVNLNIVMPSGAVKALFFTEHLH